MGKIKYSYCLNENNELVHISEVNVEDRHSHTYFCLECGQEMMAKIGKKNKPHFAHAKDTACDGESYLHKLAKRRIREKFMSSENFPITFVRDVPCQEYKQCMFYENEGECIKRDVEIKSDLKKYKGNIVYDNCLEEVNVGEFRPDLLLTGPIEKLKVLFIEIYKTHASEKQKLTSEYKIIETKQIKCEEDIDDIINRGFVEGENCTTHNFSPKLPSIRIKDVPIDRFILFRSGTAMTDYVMCVNMNQKKRKGSVRELNFRRDIVDIWDDEQLDSYQKGLVYLRKKGIQFKNCILCKNYKVNYRGDDHICVLYKILGAQTTRPKQAQASNCPNYEENPKLMKTPLSELEKEFYEVKREE